MIIKIQPILQYKRIKWSLQRLFRGYGDDDLWGISWLLIKKIKKPLSAFVKYNIKCNSGVPCSLMKYDKYFKATVSGKEANRQWVEIQIKMVRAFDLLDKENDFKEKTIKQSAKEAEEIQEGLELFGKYFQDLWN